MPEPLFIHMLFKVDIVLAFVGVVNYHALKVKGGNLKKPGSQLFKGIFCIFQ